MSIRKKGEKFDGIGAVSFSLGLTALLYVLTLGIEYSFTSTPIVVLFILFLIGVAFFIWWERRASNPVLDLSLFNNRVYNFSVLSAMIQSLALFAVNFLIVFYLQGVRGFDPLKAALLLIPLPVATSIIAPLGGNIATESGTRPGNDWLVDSGRGSDLVHAIHSDHFAVQHRRRFSVDGNRRRLVLSA